MGDDIFFIGYLGLVETLLLLENKEKKTELERRFPRCFLQQVQNLDQLPILRSVEHPSWLPICSGGIYETLRILSEKQQVGFMVDLANISIWQETIEIFEFYQWNPYRIPAAGCYLLLSEPNGKEIIQLMEQGYPVRRIGKRTNNRKRIVYRGEEESYI